MHAHDPPLLEVAANSLASAIAAQQGGAGRVELCSALELGGLTPSHAQIALAREALRIPLVVLVRPRAGGFLYDDDEFATMLRDVETCASLRNASSDFPALINTSCAKSSASFRPTNRIR